MRCDSCGVEIRWLEIKEGWMAFDKQPKRRAVRVRRTAKGTILDPRSVDGEIVDTYTSHETCP